MEIAACGFSMTTDLGEHVQQVRGKRVVVAGLGRFGGQIAAARWLVEQGATVLVTDTSPAQKLAESVQRIEELPIEFRLGEHRESDFSSADLIVTSPAIKPTNPFLQAAIAAGVPITTEIRLFIERCPVPIIGVTGTKGKSTTTRLLGDMLKTRFVTHVGGNIGKSLLLDLESIEKSDLVVLELSSFMLHYLEPMRWSPHLAVVTMLAADHLDWHGDRAAYLHAKANIVRFQRPDDIAVLSKEDPESGEFERLTPGQVVRYGLRNRRPFELKIPGAHNQLNAQAAYAAAEQLGISRNAAQEAIADFRGLPHRLQLVHETDGVRYYDDSIATGPEAALAALDSFPAKRVIQIVGGADKGLDLSALYSQLPMRAKAILCIGKVGDKIASDLSESVHPAGAPVVRCGDLPTAMQQARQMAKPGDVVLLSPGCASFGEFDNFEKRGEAFARLAAEGM
jgi:UDP-N-acetylmuramoylalanine--D-glutamate ligase